MMKIRKIKKIMLFKNRILVRSRDPLKEYVNKNIEIKQSTLWILFGCANSDFTMIIPFISYGNSEYISKA